MNLDCDSLKSHCEHLTRKARDLKNKQNSNVSPAAGQAVKVLWIFNLPGQTESLSY